MSEMKMLLVYTALFFTVEAYNMKFDYQISEGKARFVENIETNLGKNWVKIYTPAHNDVFESYKMQDFNKGLQIMCLPSLQQCRLRKIDVQKDPDAGKITESFVHSWNKGGNSISSANSLVITELYYVDAEEVLDTVFLGEELRQFYERFEFPLYREKQIPSDAEVLNITHSTGGRRVKRSFTQLNNDCRGQTPKTVYGVDTGKSCNYLKICEKVARINGIPVFTDCDNVHITSPLAYICVCCPWVQEINPKGDDCACEKMNGP